MRINAFVEGTKFFEHQTPPNALYVLRNLDNVHILYKLQGMVLHFCELQSFRLSACANPPASMTPGQINTPHIVTQETSLSHLTLRDN